MIRLILLFPLALLACSTVPSGGYQIHHDPLTVVELRMSADDRQKGTIVITDRARLRTESHELNISTGYLVTPEEYHFLVNIGRISEE